MAGTKITPQTIRAMKGSGQKIAALTAYDFPMTRLLDEVGIPLILVGDSLGMVVLGYPDTTGQSAIGWRITDALADPPGLTEQFHTETLLRLPRTFLCYRPFPPAQHADTSSTRRNCNCSPQRLTTRTIRGRTDPRPSRRRLR